MSTAPPVVEPGSIDNSLEALPRRAQIERLRQLATAALSAYDLPPIRLALLVHRYNTTFRVDAATGERYVLRIHRSGTPTVENVNSELAWLHALRRDTDLEVPAPVPTRDGPLLTVAAVPGVLRPHICVLFRWMPGQLWLHGLSARQMERVGELMGRLQNHATGWVRPPGFARGRVDWPVESAEGRPDPFAPEVVASIERLVATNLSAAEGAQVAAALERVRAAEQALGPAGFGLIHADLHYRNLLFDGKIVRAIDFDDCGFGPWLWDLAVMLSELLDWADYPALRAALIAGYRRVRPLPPEHEVYVDAFIALRQMQDVFWMLDTRHHPALPADRVARVRESLARLPALLPGLNAPDGRA